MFTIKTVVVLPHEFVHCLTHYLYPNCDKTLIGINNLGILEYRKVIQTVCCYLPGEVSHIENILAREYKEKQTRNLVRSEYATEYKEETEIENLSDVTTATRNELSTEIAKVREKERSSNYGGSLTVKGTMFGQEVEANAHADFANSNSSSQSNTTSEQYAKEITKRALERIVTKTSSKRSSKIIKEFEEQHKHGFDNRAGTSHVTGVYRWLDIVYKNQLVSYGNQLLIEFMIPEPHDFFNIAIKNIKPDSKESDPIVEPTILTDLGINSAQDVTRENYEALAQQYGISIISPKEELSSQYASVNPVPPVDRGSWSSGYNTWTHEQEVHLDDQEYKATSVNGSYKFEYKRNSGTKAYFTLNVGGVTKSHQDLKGGRQWKNGNISDTPFSSPLSGSVEVVATGFKLYTYQLNLNIGLTLRDEVFNDWQQQAFDQLKNAESNLVNEFEQKVNDQEQEVLEEVEERYTSNPSLNRIVEQRELKRACIELLTEPFCRPQGVNYICHDDCNESERPDDSCTRTFQSTNFKIPSIKRNQNLDNYTKQINFFEGAFRWDAMSYIFYPYYWADKCNWVNLFNNKDSDPIFEGFRQAGMAKVVVPVNNEFAEALLLYMKMGDIYLGGDLIPECPNGSTSSLLEDISDFREHKIGEAFESRVPTTLAIVQGKSAYLDDEGLPCCDWFNQSENDSSDENNEPIRGFTIPIDENGNGKVSPILEPKDEENE